MVGTSTTAEGEFTLSLMIIDLLLKENVTLPYQIYIYIKNPVYTCFPEVVSVKNFQDFS